MLIDLLFGSYRQKALSLLLLHPDERYYVRELARLTGTAAGTLHRELSKLAAGGLLLREQQGNQVLYSANKACPIFEELASLFRKTSGLIDILRTTINPLKENIQFSFVFGSIARGQETSSSDIDLLIIGDISFIDAVKTMHVCQETLQREINPVVYSKDELLNKIKENDPFILELINQPQMYIIGSPDDFRKLISHP